MVFGIFRSIKKSSKLIKIYKILSDVSMDFDMDTMFKKSREKEKAIDDLIEIVFEDLNNKPIIKKYKITKKIMKKKYQDLIVNGAGVVARNHWVAASALVYPQTLSFVFDKKHKLRGQAMSFALIDYFDQNRVGPVVE
tara:strand:+ start:282 stop:695 length:414 start_codon:yes stop_codon:yes gene_type:complete